MENLDTKNKFKSRTFWITIIWMSLIPIAVVAQVIVTPIEIPIASIVSFAGSISLLYIGGNKGASIIKNMKTDSPVG